MARLTLKHDAPHKCRHAEFGRSALKGVEENPQKNWRALELRSFGMSAFDLKIYAHPRHVLPHQISSATKGVHINRREP